MWPLLALWNMVPVLLFIVLYKTLVHMVLAAYRQISVLTRSRIAREIDADLRERAQAITSSRISERSDAVCRLYQRMVHHTKAGNQGIAPRTARALREQGATAPLLELLVDTRCIYSTPLLTMLMLCSTDSKDLDAIHSQLAQAAAATLVQHLDAIGVPAEMKLEHQGVAAVVLSNLCSKSATCSRVAAEAGAIPKLVRLLEASPMAKARNGAAQALIELIKVSVNRSRQAAACSLLGAAAQAVISGPSELHIRAAALIIELMNKLATELPEQQLLQAVDACMCLLRQDTASKLHPQAMLILSTLMGSAPVKFSVAMLAGGILPLLHKKLKTSDWRDRAQAVQLLAQLLQLADDAQKEEAVALGALEAACGLIYDPDSNTAISSGVVLSVCCYGKDHHAKHAAKAGAVRGFVCYFGKMPRGAWHLQNVSLSCIVLSKMLSLPCDPQHLQQAIDAGLPALLLDVLQKLRWELQGVHLKQALLGIFGICRVLQLAGMLRVLAPLVEPLVQLLAQGSSLEEGSAGVAMALLGNIANGSPELREAVRAKGAEGLARAWLDSEGMPAESAEWLLNVLLGEPDERLIQLPERPQQWDTLEAVHRLWEETTTEVNRLNAAAAKAARVCAMCGAKSAPGDKALLNCSACKQVSYCGQQCQRKHWKKHKRVCEKGLQEEEEEEG